MSKNVHDSGAKVNPEPVHWPQEEEVPTVSEVVGEGADAHRIVQVGPWKFTAWVGRGEGEEPRMRDVDLGARLEYGRVKDIRLLAREQEKAGNINPFHVRAAVARTGAAPRFEDEMWFTEAEALWLASQSKTPRAVAVTKEMIRVYMLARKGLLPQQRPAPSAEAFTAMALEVGRAMVLEFIAPIRTEMAKMREDFAKLPQGVISGLQADELRRTVEYLAMCYVALDERKSTKAARGHVYERLKAAIAWGFRGSQIHTMPAAKYAEAVACLRGIKLDVEHRLDNRRRKVAAKKQRDLFEDKDPTKKPN